MAFFLAPFLLLAQTSSDQSFTVGLQFGENTDPPTVPADVTAVPISHTQIDVAWSASVDPFGVAGYQVFRDSTQVATTSLTSFSDTGLTASTTYSYTVRAFDGAGNISSSSAPVATTTFAAPPPPPEDPAPVPSSSSFQAVTLQQFSLETGSGVARFDFGTNVPVSYRIQYGVTDTLADGVAQTDTLRQQHTTVLTDLESNTTYYYELYVTDRFSRETLLRSGSFTTEQQFVVDMPVNVAEFSAQVIGNDVMLRWSPAQEAPYAYVRVVRNSRFFPNDPLDGVVVYQGPNTSFTDLGAMGGLDRQYYTIFAYNLAGVPSSGMLAIAARTPTLPSEPPDPVVPPVTDEEEDDEAELPPPLPPVSAMTLSDIELIQHDRLHLLSDAVTLGTDASFVLRVPSRFVPTETRLVMVTLWRPEDERSLSFLLQLDTESDHYRAVIPALARPGTYDVRIELYNGVQERFFYLSGLFAVEEPETVDEAPIEEDWLLVSVFYMLLGGALGVFIALGLYRSFLYLWHRRHHGHAYSEHR